LKKCLERELGCENQDAMGLEKEEEEEEGHD
jgi:hypothetical protein